jgi:hypothetical protein
LGEAVKKLVGGLLALVLLTGGVLIGAGVASAAPPGRCNDYVHLFSLTGQVSTAWQSRVAGTDLQRLVNDNSGHAFITINDDDGSETLDILWDDRGHPLNTVITLNGLHPSVYVSITNSTNRYIGCSQTYNLTYHRN